MRKIQKFTYRKVRFPLDDPLSGSTLCFKNHLIQMSNKQFSKRHYRQEAGFIVVCLTRTAHSYQIHSCKVAPDALYPSARQRIRFFSMFRKFLAILKTKENIVASHLDEFLRICFSYRQRMIRKWLLKNDLWWFGRGGADAPLVLLCDKYSTPKGVRREGGLLKRLRNFVLFFAVVTLSYLE